LDSSLSLQHQTKYKGSLVIFEPFFLSVRYPLLRSPLTMTAKRVGYLTDVEGNYEYFQRYVALSSTIEYDSKQNLTFKDDNSLFVFGGDVCDKGTGSIRITRQLVAFKKKYPERVILIMGNRDINKMRWTSELAQTEIDNLDSVPGPYWVKKESQVTPKQFIQKIADQTKVPVQAANTVANRIKWMLDTTMGAAGDFERRRQELSIITNNVKPITDEQVAKSYMDSVLPNGEMYEFLSLGQLAFIHEGTLFVHGGVTKSNIGYVPFDSVNYNNVAEWVEALNKWYSVQFIDWTLKPKWEYQKNVTFFVIKRGEKFDASIQGPPKEEQYEDPAMWGARGAHRLLDYALPTTKGSVVYSHMFNKLNNCQPLDIDVRKRLTEHGIVRVVTGHQPHGNAPAVNKATDDIEIIDSDSSYSDMTASDNRGKAVSEIVIAGRRVFVKGVLHDGQSIKYDLSLDRGEGDQYIGKQVPLPDDKDGNSFWVKAKLENTPSDGREYILCKVTGFVVSYDHMSKEKLDEIIYNRKIIYTDEDVCSLTVKGKAVPITKLPHITTRLSEVIEVPFFKDWVEKIQSSPDIILKRVEIHSIDHSGFRIRFIKLNATLQNRNGDSISGVMLLRGNSVAVLCIIITEDNKKLVLTVKHPRSPIGSADHIEIPIGMQEQKHPLELIRNLLESESGMEFDADVAVNLSKYLFDDENKKIYVSPGSCDQGVQFFLVEKFLTTQQVAYIQENANNSDVIAPYETVFVPYEKLEEQCCDGNAIIAARLYELYLKKKAREGTAVETAPSLNAPKTQ
jgi:hypothetical protein